jgi:hypothetical protein
MALEEFENEKLSDRDKGLVRMRSITNYVMGIMIIGAGIVFLFPPASMVERINQYDPAMIKLMAVVCFIYGAFRIYRGYSKNYFRER